jgi:23S rRNA pseudouridine1911/1915/1917 synthase
MTLVADREERLDRFLAQAFPDHSRTKLARWIGDGKVLVDGKPAKPSLKLEPGMVVELDEPEKTPAHDLTPAQIELKVVFEDDEMLVVDKPRGLATHPAPSLKEPSLVNALLARPHALSQGSGSYRPGIVHRLDRETTGLLVVAKTDSAHVRLAQQMEAKTAAK